MIELFFYSQCMYKHRFKITDIKVQVEQLMQNNPQRARWQRTRNDFVFIRWHICSETAQVASAVRSIYLPEPGLTPCQLCLWEYLKLTSNTSNVSFDKIYFTTSATSRLTSSDLNAFVWINSGAILNSCVIQIFLPATYIQFVSVVCCKCFVIIVKLHEQIY